MMAWPQNPTLYEINTAVWLQALTQRFQRPVTLDDVPAEIWDNLASLHLDAVWLMGVWERSPRGKQIASEHEGLQAEYHAALHDFTAQDVIGSPYAIHNYVVDERLGGPAGLAAARKALAERGIKLILDFVPNHVAVDHPWTTQHPEHLISGTEADLATEPDNYFQSGVHIFANGRDPYFSAWTDTAQLNAFSLALRGAVVETLNTIGHQCDGVRVDMAMLMVKRIFAQTWGEKAGAAPPQEFWWEVINAVHSTHPDMLFVAEVYWDMEWELQQQGFDYCYDKRLYDRLAKSDLPALHEHLTATAEYQSHLVRFIENHDEPRAASVFQGHHNGAAAVASTFLPGARLFYEGQFEGATLQLPVQLSRRQPEIVNSGLQDFYQTLRYELSQPIFHNGQWQLCERTGWPDNTTHENLIAYCWQHEDERRLIVVNLTNTASTARVLLPWEDLISTMWELSDSFSGESFLRYGNEMLNDGLYVGLGEYQFHFFRFRKSAW